MPFECVRRPVRRLLGVCCTATAFLFAPALPAQTAFPSKPITLIVPFPAGGVTDTQFRALAQAATRELRQPMVVVNQPGAAGTLGPANMAKAAAGDGHTLSVITSALWRLPHVQPVGYDVHKDFTYIAAISEYVFGVAVAADSPFKTVHDLVAAAQAAPDRIAVGAISNGSTGHLSLMRWSRMAGFQPNFIPYKGGADAIQALLGGHIHALSEAGWGTLVHQGKLRALALYTDERVKQFPDVPTLKELGWNVSANSAIGIAGPRNMDPAVVLALQRAFLKATDDPQFRKSLESAGQGVSYMDSAAYTRFVAEQFTKEQRTVEELKAAGVALN